MESNENIQKLTESLKHILATSSSQSFDNFMFPIIKNVAFGTIAQNLVPVMPMGGGTFGEERERIDRELKQQNREAKIEAITEDKEYIEKTREDHPDWVSSEGSSGILFYLDYQYNSGTSSSI